MLPALFPRPHYPNSTPPLRHTTPHYHFGHTHPTPGRIRIGPPADTTPLQPPYHIQTTMLCSLLRHLCTRLRASLQPHQLGKRVAGLPAQLLLLDKIRSHTNGHTHHRVHPPVKQVSVRHLRRVSVALSQKVSCISGPLVDAGSSAWPVGKIFIRLQTVNL